MCDKSLKYCSRSFQDECQTPGAGSSRPTSRIIPPPRAHLSSRSSTASKARPVSSKLEIELGVYLQPRGLYLNKRPLLPLEDTQFEMVELVKSNKGLTSMGVGKSIFLANSTWRTNIVAFCCQVRINPILSNAYITHVQARKSRRLPFLHEYILVFFTTERDQRFVLRIDRLGKCGSTSDGWQQGVASNTAIQEVGVYHIEDAQSGVDSPDGAWLAMDGKWGSYPIATLATWENEEEPRGRFSHRLQTVAPHGEPRPELKDVSRLLEAILLEMPTYHLTTTNCYLMTRSSLLLLQRCYPKAFTCHLGSMTGELIPGSKLAEPVWAGLIEWYLPFVVLFFLVYIPLVGIIHYFMGTAVSYDHSSKSDEYYVLCIIHAYMTSLEEEMNDLVVRLLVQFLEIQRSNQQVASMPAKPFSVLIEGPWMILMAWCALGGIGALFVFFSLIFRYGLFVVFLISLVIAIWFNLTYPGSEYELSTGVDDVFTPPSECSNIFDTVP